VKGFSIPNQVLLSSSVQFLIMTSMFTLSRSVHRTRTSIQEEYEIQQNKTKSAQ